MHYAIRFTSVVNATLFTNCAPIFVAVFGLVGLTAKSSPEFWKALPISLFGIILIVSNSGDGTASSLYGDGIALIAGALYAAYLTTVKKLRDLSVPSSHIMVTVSVGSTVILTPLAFNIPHLTSVSWESWMLLLVLAFIGHALGQGLVTVALQKLSVSSSSIVLMIQPAVAALLSWAILGENMIAPQLAGVIAVLSGLYIATSRSR